MTVERKVSVVRSVAGSIRHPRALPTGTGGGAIIGREGIRKHTFPMMESGNNGGNYAGLDPSEDQNGRQDRQPERIRRGWLLRTTGNVRVRMSARISMTCSTDTSGNAEHSKEYRQCTAAAVR
jgi:hypothetical protein